MSEEVHHDLAGKHWPIVGSFGLFFIAIGVINWLHENSAGPWLFLLGAVIISYMIWGWFADVIEENRTVYKDDQLTYTAFKWGVFWFIFTEIMLFAAVFGALFYARVFSVPWLGGVGAGTITHLLLWPDFQNFWPVFHTPDPSKFIGPHGIPDPWHIPALNTLAILGSDIGITWAYWSALNNHKRQLITGLFLALALSIIFLLLQVHEYGMAYTELGLRISSGIYANLFYMLTGLHASHILDGEIMVIVMIFRAFKGHFGPGNTFALAATTWFWQFIVVLWLIMFVFVYWV